MASERSQRWAAARMLAIGIVVAAAGACSSTSSTAAPTVPAAAPTVTTAATATTAVAGETGTPAPAGSLPGTGTLTGTWSGTWTRDVEGGGGTINFEVQQIGDVVSGAMTLGGSVCMTKPTAFTGSFDGTTMTIAAKGTGYEVDFTGTLAGTTLTGTLKSQCSLGTGTGKWTATKP